jgi:high-affinity nickel permease
LGADADEGILMLNVITVATLGFLLGMRHATDADHVIAVSTIVSRQRGIRSAGLIGILWGFGHSLTILSVGAAIILFNVTISPRVGLAMELAVGVMLVVLGALNLTGGMQWAAVRCASNDSRRLQVHPDNGHQAPALQNLRERIGLYEALRPLIVGIVHGLAGSAAVALLVLATIRNPLWAVAYLLVFGVGTIAGMMLMTIAIGVPLSLAGERHAQFGGKAAAACGLISVAFGFVLTYRICFLEGLFTGPIR